jgi:hypothetical protein
MGYEVIFHHLIFFPVAMLKNFYFPAAYLLGGGQLRELIE